MKSLSIEMLKDTLANSGGTYDNKGHIAIANSGYYVGGFSEVFKIALDDPECITKALSALRRLTDDKNNWNYYIGTWIEHNILYIEKSEWYKHRNQAIWKASIFNQIAIWDCKNKSNIFLNVTG